MARAKRRSSNDKKAYKVSRVGSQPQHWIKGLDRKRAEQKPMLIELWLREEAYQKISPE